MIDGDRLTLWLGLGLTLYTCLLGVSFWCRARARRSLFQSLSRPGVADVVIERLAAYRDIAIEPSDDPRAQAGLYCPRRGLALVAPSYIASASARVLALLGHEVQHGRQHRTIGLAFWLFDLPQWLQLLALLAIAAAGIVGGAVPAWLLWSVMLVLYLGRFGFEVNANTVSINEIRASGASPVDLREARSQLALGAATYGFGYLAFILCRGLIAWSASLFHQVL